MGAAMNLQIEDVAKSYGDVEALKGVSLDIAGGDLVCFLGPSGCGKTTLLRIIAGLEQATAGRILLGGRDLSRVAARQRGFGMVFQSYSLFPNMTARRNVGYGLEVLGWSKARIAERVDQMLRLVALADQAAKYPPQMSGGQQQRIALARALATDPALLLLDEPLSALDAKVREDLRTEIRAVQRRLGITTIMVTHDQDEALTMADKIVVLQGGRVEQVGTPLDLYARPATPFVAQFIGRMNLLDVGPAAGGQAVFAGVPLDLGRPGPARLVGIRPEAVRVEAAAAGGPNVVQGVVAETIYLGNILRLVVTPDGPPAPKLLVETHGGTDPPGPGTRVTLRLPPAALQVLA